MKVVIPTDSGKVSMHFGRCPEFTIFKIKENKIKNKKVIDNPGHKPGFLPKFLNKRGADCLITGGIGRRAVNLFNKYEIEVISGAKGEADKVIEDFLKGEIEGKDNICDH